MLEFLKLGSIRKYKGDSFMIFLKGLDVELSDVSSSLLSMI